MGSGTTQHLITGDEDHFLPKLIADINLAKKIDITVSFIRQSGLRLIFNVLMDACNSNVEVRILTGDYLNITEPVALRNLLLLQESGADIRVYETKGVQSFHMKAYIFVFSNQTRNEGHAYVGSSNISSSALSYGLEWNLRVAAEENPARFEEISEKFEKIYHHPKTIRLSNEWIESYQTRIKNQPVILFPEFEQEETILPPEPNTIQQEALAALRLTREKGYKRGLVVLATGLGKTWLAAFDCLQSKSTKVLFVAHREEILAQAESTFVRILPEAKVGKFVGDNRQMDADMLFASIQTLGKKQHLEKFSADHFDYIVVDEFHHASARTYQQVLAHFNPRFLLGLTATPERTDQVDILALCDNNLVYRRDMYEGINSELLCPFAYFGIADEVDYQSIPWRNGKFDPDKLLNQLATKARAKHALTRWKALKQSRTLAFCISKKHADYMADYFQNNGFKAVSVHSDSTVRRNDALSQLESGEIDIVFSVDLFNEGTDLPAIDTVLMLRPSESKIIFLQQLGRGLRTCLNKEKLVVLDFIGNHISFFRKPEALFGVGVSKSERKKFIEQIQNGSLKLANGCFVNYDIQAVEFLEQLIATRIDSQKDLYKSLKESKGRRPSLAEFYKAGGEPSTIRKEFDQWLKFISVEQDSSGIEDKCVEQNETFFKEIEITNLTKSYKIVLLEALLELDGLTTPVKTIELASRSFQIIRRRHNLIIDLPEKFKELTLLDGKNIGLWHTYWKNNPINAWIGGNKKTEDAFFKVENNRLVFQGNVSLSQMGVFMSFIRELIDYRYLQYKERQQQSSKKRVKPKAEVINIAKARKVEVQYFPDLKIACGHFKTSDHDEESVNKIFLPEHYGRLDSNRHFIAQATGNSMDGGKNAIKDGDYLLLETITPDRAGSISNKIIAIERQDMSGDDQYLLRNVKKIGTGDYQLIASNPDYEPMQATEEMRTFARLLGVVNVDDINIKPKD